MCWWFFILYFPCGVEIVHILLRKMKDTECMIWFAKIQVRFATYLHTIAILSSREVHALSLLHFSREVHALSLLHVMIRHSGSQSFFGLRFSAGMSQDSLRVTSHIASLTSTNKPRKYFEIIYAPFSFISIKVTKWELYLTPGTQVSNI